MGSDPHYLQKGITLEDNYRKQRWHYWRNCLTVRQREPVTDIYFPHQKLCSRTSISFWNENSVETNLIMAFTHWTRQSHITSQISISSQKNVGTPDRSVWFSNGLKDCDPKFIYPWRQSVIWNTNKLRKNHLLCRLGGLGSNAFASRSKVQTQLRSTDFFKT